MLVQPYLVFNGNCKEAFEFYAKVLKGKIEAMLTHADIPADSGMPPTPPEWRDRIMHSCLSVDGAIIMGSDAPPQHYTVPGGFSVSLQINDVAEAERVYKELSEGGTVMMPLAPTFWATRFSMFVDRYSTPWMINCNAPSA